MKIDLFLQNWSKQSRLEFPSSLNEKKKKKKKKKLENDYLSFHFFSLPFHTELDNRKKNVYWNLNRGIQKQREILHVNIYFFCLVVLILVCFKGSVNLAVLTSKNRKLKICISIFFSFLSNLIKIPTISLSLCFALSLLFFFPLLCDQSLGRENFSLSLSLFLSHFSVAIMFLDKGSTQSNLDCFLHCTTPIVRSQFLPKVCLIIYWILCFFIFGLLNVNFVMWLLLFVCCRLRWGTLTVYGIHGRGKRLSTLHWVIYGIVMMNGVHMELEFQLFWATAKPWFSIMCLIFLQFKYSPAVLVWMG